MTRLSHALRSMAPEQRLALLASVSLLVTMLCPWYGLQSLDRKTSAINSHNISAFGDVSFVEAAVFLVAVGVAVIVLARAEGHEFQLPGGDGTIVTIAGCWAGLLIFYRVFDRPAGHGYPVGIEWGFFLAFMAAGALAYAGWRMRAAEHPAPPLTRPRGMRRSGSGPDRDARRAPTRGPEEEITAQAPVQARPGRSTPGPARGQGGRAPGGQDPCPPEQLSFEDPKPGPER